MDTRQSADEIESAAARWLWRLDREGSDERFESELRDWLEGDSRRRGAFLKAQAAWSVVGQAYTPEALPVTDVALNSSGRLPRRRRIHAIAASVAAVMVVSAAAIWLAGFQRYQTAMGEIRQVPLDDGSTAMINTDSAVVVSMTDARREIALKQGEAWFQVARDAQRPFVVEIGRVRVRALGTAFSVRRYNGSAEIIVTEGTVETWAVGAEGHTARVAAGAKAHVADNAAITVGAIDAAQIDRVLAWRTGRIDLAGETLGAAVAEFNRYNHRKLVIESPQIAQQRLYGMFRINDPQGFAYAVRRSLGADVSLPNKREIRLRSGADGS